VDIMETARKHEVSDEDMLHALKHHQHAYIEDDRGFKMYVGPSTTGELLEVGVVTRGEHARIVHAMPARAELLPRRTGR